MIGRAGPQYTNQPLGKIITQPLVREDPWIRQRKKWVDDIIILTSIYLQDTLVPNSNPIRLVPTILPEHILPEEHESLQS